MEISPDALVDQLAEKMANLIVDHLEAEKIPKPLIIVDIFYHYADVYLPLVSYHTTDRLKYPLGSEGILFEQKEGPISLDPTSVDEQLAQLMDLEWNHEGMRYIGQRMVRKTAAILNQTKLWGRLPTHDLFGAYACDGTVEGHSPEDWAEILTECGLTQAQRTAWKRAGFYP